MPLAIVLPVRFTEAIRAATRRKVALPSVYYGKAQAQARTRAFTVSGLAGIAQITQALDSLNDGLRQGMTFGEWKALAVEQEWNLPDARLDLILRNHTQSAYNAGAWEQFERVADRRGFLMYSAINDSRTRASHAAMDGIIRPIGDDFWDHHSPPCGYNCRCTLISLTQAQADDRGGVTDQIPDDAIADPGWGSRPTRGAADLDPDVAREKLDLPGPLQEEIARWHEDIREERIADRVREAIDRYDDFADEVQEFQQDTDGLLAEHEAVSLRAYSGSFYTRMNAFLRGEGGDDLNMMAAVSSAPSGLAKLPAFEGTVYRGIYWESVRNPVTFLAAHVEGEVLEYSAFLSASYARGFHGTMQYTIRSRSGRVIEDLSLGPEEKEVLFPPGTKFRVIAIDKTASPITIELEELADQTTPVADNRKFAKDDSGQPAEKVGQGAQDRAQNEALEADADKLARFMREHDGMTPIQYALSRFASARVDVSEAFPHLLPPPKK